MDFRKKIICLAYSILFLSPLAAVSRRKSEAKQVNELKKEKKKKHRKESLTQKALLIFIPSAGATSAIAMLIMAKVKTPKGNENGFDETFDKVSEEYLSELTDEEDSQLPNQKKNKEGNESEAPSEVENDVSINKEIALGLGSLVVNGLAGNKKTEKQEPLKPKSILGLTPIQAISCAANGQYLVVLYNDGKMALCSLVAGKLTTNIPLASEAKITCILCSPFENYFLAGGVNGLIYIWDLASKQCIGNYKGHSAVSCIAHHPTARCFVTGGKDGKLMGWHAYKTLKNSNLAVKEFQIYKQQGLIEQRKPIDLVAISTSGVAAMCSDDGLTIRVFPTLTANSKPVMLEFHKKQITQIFFTADNILISMDLGGQICLWQESNNIEWGYDCVFYQQHHTPILTCQLYGRLILGLDQKHKIHFWQLKVNQQAELSYVKEFDTGKYLLKDMALLNPINLNLGLSHVDHASSSSNITYHHRLGLLGVTQDNEVVTWVIETENQILEVFKQEVSNDDNKDKQGKEKGLSALTFWPQDHSFVTYNNKNVYVLALPKKISMESFGKNNHHIKKKYFKGILPSPDGGLWFWGMTENNNEKKYQPFLWRLYRGIYTLEISQSAVSCVQFLSNGQLALGYQSGFFALFDLGVRVAPVTQSRARKFLNASQKVAELWVEKAHEKPLIALAHLLPSVLLTMAENGEIKSWDTELNQLLYTINSNIESPKMLQLLGSQLLFVGNASKMNGVILDEKSMYTHTSLSVEFAKKEHSCIAIASNQLVVTGYGEGDIMFWAIGKEKKAILLGTVKAHKNRVTTLVFSQLGDMLATSDNYAIKLWSIQQLNLAYTALD